MVFVNEYKNWGGCVMIGFDSGFIFQFYGFVYICELELLCEVGFYLLEVICLVMFYGVEVLGMVDEIGMVEVGKKVDFVIVVENLLVDFKVFYGMGVICFDENNEVVCIEGVCYIVKDGVVYDVQ